MDEDVFDFSDTDEGIMKEGLNNFEHKKMFDQPQRVQHQHINNNLQQRNGGFSIHQQMSINTQENSTQQFQYSLPQNTQVSTTSISLQNYKRMSPQKHQQDVKPHRLIHDDTLQSKTMMQNVTNTQQSNQHHQYQYNNNKQQSKKPGNTNGLTKSQSQSFLHSKRNTIEIGNRENVDMFNRTIMNNNQNNNNYQNNLKAPGQQTYQQEKSQTFHNNNNNNFFDNSQQLSNKSYAMDVDFKKAYQKLAKEMQNINPNLVPSSARQTFLGVNGGIKNDYGGLRTFDRSSVSQSQLFNDTSRKFNLQEFTQKQHDFEERKRQKLAQLQEQIDSQDIEECTFMPNKHRSQSANRTAGLNRRLYQQQRNMEQFLEDQAKKEEERQIKINLQSEMLLIKQKEELKGKPQINQKSRKLIEKKLSQQQNHQDVHNRLYELNNKQKHQMLNHQQNQQHDSNGYSDQSKQLLSVEQSKQINENMSFRPKIHKKSQQIKRQKPIDQHLYEDFRNRQLKKEQLKQDLSQQEQYNLQMMTSKQLSQNSEKYFIQRFTKEIIREWQTLSLDEQSQTNETLNYLIYKGFLARLGFINERYISKNGTTTSTAAQKESDTNDFDGDRNIVYDLWRYLGGEVKSHITLNNLRIFLLAIMGTFVEPGLNRAEQNLFRIDEQLYGLFNDQGDLFLDPSEIPRIQKEFYQFYLNRTQFEAQMREMRKKERMQQKEFDFKPQVNKVSNDIAKKYREKMEQAVQSKLSTIDWLVQPAKNPRWQETAQEIVQQEEMRECTFQPQVRKGSTTRVKSSEPHNQYMQSKHFANRKDSTQSASKIRSRELMPNTGNKFNDLFELSKKMQPLKEHQDKSAQDYEYERMKDECSFKPQILKTVDGLGSGVENSFYKGMGQSRSVANLNATQKSIERMKKARQDKEELEMIKSSGRHRNDYNGGGLVDMQSPNRSIIKQSNSSAIKSSKNASAFKTKGFNKTQTFGKQSNKFGHNTSQIQNPQLDPTTFDDYLGASQSNHNSNSMHNNNFHDKHELQMDSESNIQPNERIQKPFPQTPNEHLQHQQLQHQDQMNNQSNSPTTNSAATSTPMLYVDINLGEGVMERITVFPGNTPQQLAQEFSVRHQLDEETMHRLEELLHQQIQNVLVHNQQVQQ